MPLPLDSEAKPGARLHPADALAAVGMAVILMVMLGVVLGLLGSGHPLLGLLASQAALAVPAVVVLSSRRGWAMHRPSPRAAIACVLGGAGAFLISAALTARLYHTGEGSYADTVEESLSVIQASITPFGLVLLLAVVVPLVEELMFRGVVLFALARFGPVTAIGASSALFALYHLHPVHALVAFTVGLVCGVSVWRTGTWWAGVLVHATNNAIVCALMFASPTIDAEATLHLYWALPGLAAITLGWLLVRSQPSFAVPSTRCSDGTFVPISASESPGSDEARS